MNYSVWFYLIILDNNQLLNSIGVIAVCLCVLSPGGIRCSSSPCASSICPVRRTHPQPLSVVREASWGKPRLYVSHRRDAKQRRKQSLSSETVTELELKFTLLFFRIRHFARGLTVIPELVGLSQHDHRRALAEFGFLLQGPAWNIKEERETV